MNVLFVTPSQVSVGESITSLQMAERLSEESHGIHFLASQFTGDFIRGRLRAAVTDLGPELRANQDTWDKTLRRFRPTCIIFADYPLLTFDSGVAPLLDESWEGGLSECEAQLFTLDHLGYAQKPRLVFFGPPQKTIGIQRIPKMPPQIGILLPCPLHDPETTKLKGRAFRYWQTDASRHPADSTEWRGRYVQDERQILILHLVSGWACRAAELLNHPYYEKLPRLLSYYLKGLGRPVTVLSVNSGEKLPEGVYGNVRVVNAKPMEPAQFERILLTSDLILTENRISVSLGKAVSSLRPCAVLKNSHGIQEIIKSASNSLTVLAQEMERAQLGSVFPFEVFPIWSRADLQELDIFDESCLKQAFGAFEIFGGEETMSQLQALLIDGSAREKMRAAQAAYLQRIESLPTPSQVLEGGRTHEPC
jgi:hypothetical protein